MVRNKDLHLNGDECQGLFSEDSNGELLIQIQDNLKGMPLLRTLVHELWHANAHITGMAALLGDKYDEAVASQMEHILLPLVIEAYTLVQKGQI